MSSVVNEIIAKAIRVEYNSDTGEVYLVFEVIDEDFKRMIKKDWTQDIDLKVVEKNLVLNKE